MTDYTDLARRIAREYTLDPRILIAVMEQESGGDPYAYRPEPHYRWFWNVHSGAPFRSVTPDEIASKIAPPDFPCLGGTRDQEWWGQQASWGLCQIMGAVAREQDFKGRFLTELCVPEVNLDLGARLLRAAIAWAHGDERLAIGSYNAGRGGAHSTQAQAYAAAVLARKIRLA